MWFHTEYIDESNDTSLTIKIVDDKNLLQKTLGLRRLVLQKDPKVKLHKISVAIYFFADLIKLAKTTTWFIDNAGKVFQWKKYTRAKLTTKKIKNVFPADAYGCVLELVGVSHRFKAMTRPKDEQVYARVLQIGIAYIFYGYCETHKPDSWRMV